MTNKLDLHIHSSYSDGTDTPKEILAKASSLGIENIAITDHDTIRGIKEEKEAAKKYNINIVNGVELSTFSLMEVHILGYGFDENDDRLNTTLNDFSEKRKERVKKILDMLAKYKIIINEEDLEESDSIGRLHVANALVKKGYVFVRATTQAVKGQSVYMDPATGEIKTGSSAPSGYIDTGWKVETGASANQVCEIYNI